MYESIGWIFILFPGKLLASFIVDIVIVLILGALWRLGGWDKAKWSGYRDVLVPIILGAYFAITLRVWWMFFAVTAMYQLIRVGYGIPAPPDPTDPNWQHGDEGSFLGQMFIVPWLTRAVAGIFCCIGSLPIFLYLQHHGVNGWSVFFAYIELNFIMRCIMHALKARAIVEESCEGMLIGLIILAVKWIDIL